jgi:F-type H+-transporting ATPase subunit epsilon
MHLEIITPETKVFSGEVDAVQLPGLDGSFQVLKGHAPIISALDAGKVKVDLSAPLSEEQQENKLIEMDGLKTIRVAIKGGLSN